MILSGLVLVNNKPARVHEFLKENYEIVVTSGTNKKGSSANSANYKSFGEKTREQESERIKDLESKEKTTLLQKFKSIFTKEKTISTFKNEPKIIEENKDYLILEKPAGMLVHPTLRLETDTLVDWLLQKYPQIKGVGEDPGRPGLVHRLDKDVSGLIIIAKNLDSFDSLKKQFKLRTIKKYYTALVHDVIQHETGSIDFNIIRSKSGKFVALPMGSEEGKEAHTEFEVLQRFDNLTLVKINIITGRTNQIRIHFNALGHPLVGDELYMSKKIKDKIKVKLNRVFLHASSLSFLDLNNKKQNIESPLPQKLQNLLDNTK